MTAISRTIRLYLLAVVVTSAMTPALCRSAEPSELSGTMMPYPPPPAWPPTIPDSLVPIGINHLGRHGARYLSSPAKTAKPAAMLVRADSLGTITPLGRRFIRLVAAIDSLTDGRWGALDSLGNEEQRQIATRMYQAWPQVLRKGRVEAVATYVPRAVASMYAFCHRLTELAHDAEINTSEGRQWNEILRFFTTDSADVAFLRHGAWRGALARYSEATIPVAPARRLLGSRFPASRKELQGFTSQIYTLLASLPAIGRETDASTFLAPEEYERCWRVENLGHYLARSDSRIGGDTATLAAIPLLENILLTSDALAGCSASSPAAPRCYLRFAHAETILPLLALTRLPRAYMPRLRLDSVANHWHDYALSPLAANLQLIFLRAPSGNIYVLGLLNERPVPLLPGSDTAPVPYLSLRAFWLSLLPR